MVLIGPGLRDLSFEPTPHPAYGSEVSTDGNRLVRARKGNGAGCRFTPRPVFALFCRTQDPGPFPVSSTAPHYRRTKSESQEHFGSREKSGNKNRTHLPSSTAET